jgi:predicted Zn-dependent protease
MAQRAQTARPTLGALLLAALIAGCAGDQDASSLLAPVPAAAPRTTGLERQAGREHARLVAAFGGEYGAPEAKRLLAEVSARLSPATDRPDETYEITLLNSPVPNAFALPSGRLYVTRGLLALANDTAEIAAVLAHEIAHVSLRHAAARSELQARSDLVSRVAADVLHDPEGGATMRDQARFTVASFSRAQELEADEIGVKTLAKAGYDPYGAARFLQSLGRSAGVKATSGDKGPSSPDMLATHPSTPERIALALQGARRIGAPGIGDADRARYLAAVDGIAYGEDPGDGAIRGRTFIHPRLGVAFEMPEGLNPENTARAVLGVSADGSRRLLFDALDVGPGEDLGEALRSTWTEAVDPGSVEGVTVNGLPAAVAASRGKDWTFRMAAIRVGSGTFRLVLATRTATPELEIAFRRALDSVRPVTAEETRSLKPARLQIVAASEGDTIETVAGRMLGADRAVERFLALNGLDRAGAFKVGERYKIVVE